MPIGTATALIGSAIIGGTAASNAASKAAKAQTNAATQANNRLTDANALAREDLSVYRASGAQATDAANKLLGFGSPGDTTASLKALQQTPGYQFTLSQGLKAIGNQTAARGFGTGSGAFGKGLANFATGLANNTYGDQYNRLMDMSKLGESAAAQTGAFGTNTASQVAGNITGAGNAKAAAQIAGGNAISNVANAASSAFLYNKLFGDKGGMYEKTTPPNQSGTVRA